MNIRSFGLGSIRQRAGDHAEAARLMEQVIVVYPDHIEARYHLGMSYRHLGRIEEAEATLEIHSRMLESRR